jgi:hypothetical protein
MPTTPNQLAAELGISPKTLRAWLRKEFERDPALKNTNWVINDAMAEHARGHFAK